MRFGDTKEDITSQTFKLYRQAQGFVNRIRVQIQDRDDVGKEQFCLTLTVLTTDHPHDSIATGLPMLSYARPANLPHQVPAA